MVVDQQFCLRIPKNLPLDRAAPLLCAGVTVWSPMVAHGMNKPGFKLGVVGLGGLGHMAVKFGVQMGCEVTVISTSEKKRDDAMKGLGAHRFLVSSDKAAMEAADSSLDGIIDTVSAKHDLTDYVNLLDVFGKLVLVGISPDPLPLNHMPLVFKNRAVVGSVIGGIKETQGAWQWRLSPGAAPRACGRESVQRGHC
jgi:cinnamyl-alcohol dehydrogenase